MKLFWAVVRVVLAILVLAIFPFIMRRHEVIALGFNMVVATVAVGLAAVCLIWRPSLFDSPWPFGRDKDPPTS